MRENRSMRAITVLVTLFLLLSCGWLGAQDGTGAAPPSPSAALPDLPPEITLAQLVAKKTDRLTVVGKKIVKREEGKTVTRPVSEAMGLILKLQPDSLDAAAASPKATNCLKGLCRFLHTTRGPDDTVEAVIRANCKERIYKNSEIIGAACGRCSPDRVAKWRALYPDK